MNVRPWGASYFMRTDGLTDGYDEANSRIPNFAIALCKCILLVPEDVYIFCLDCNIHI